MDLIATASVTTVLIAVAAIAAVMVTGIALVQTRRRKLDEAEIRRRLGKLVGTVDPSAEALKALGGIPDIEALPLNLYERDREVRRAANKIIDEALTELPNTRGGRRGRSGGERSR